MTNQGLDGAESAQENGGVCDRPPTHTSTVLARRRALKVGTLLTSLPTWTGKAGVTLTQGQMAISCYYCHFLGTQRCFKLTGIRLICCHKEITLSLLGLHKEKKLFQSKAASVTEGLHPLCHPQACRARSFGHCCARRLNVLGNVSGVLRPTAQSSLHLCY